MADLEKDNRRSFTGSEGDVYYIEPPTADDIRGADWQYSKTYTQCLVEGITTSAEMNDILYKRGIIGPEFEERANELSENLGKAIADLDSVEELDEKREMSLKVAQAREELFQWNQRLNGPMNNTAEQISDDARLEYLTSAMVIGPGGTRMWDSYNSYLREKSQDLALKARFEVMLYLQGLDSDFLEKTPEALAMKEVENDVIAKAESAIRASQAVLEEDIETSSLAQVTVTETEEIESEKKSKAAKAPKKKKG